MDIIVIETGDVCYDDISEYAKFLTPARRSAVLKKQCDGDRVLSLVSKLLLMDEISQRNGTPRGRIKMKLGSFGKPYLPDSALKFSLSHTGGAVCAAFSDTDDLGVDIERRTRTVSERLYKRVLSEEECFHVTSNEDFLRVWVQKEAFLKRLGVGVTVDLRGVDSFVLANTAAIETEDYFIGVSGGGAFEAKLKYMELSQLLAKYTD